MEAPFISPDSPSKLTDDQWTEICRFCNFPSEARPWVENEIDCYRIRSTALGVTAEDTRGELSALSKEAESLLLAEQVRIMKGRAALKAVFQVLRGSGSVLAWQSVENRRGGGKS